MGQSPAGCAKLAHPFAALPQLPPAASCLPSPSDEECFALWDRYAMLDNVRRHSLQVAAISTALAERARDQGIRIDVNTVRASALLHDIAKTWCLKNSGSHALLGASWVAQETQNFRVSQGVALHVHWPWPLPEDDAICALPILIIYGDKRVRHDQAVSLEERFDDLIDRYGKTQEARDGIAASFAQSRQIEQKLSTLLNWNLHEHTFDSRRLVQRTGSFA